MRQSVEVEGHSFRMSGPKSLRMVTLNQFCGKQRSQVCKTPRKELLGRRADAKGLQHVAA